MLIAPEYASSLAASERMGRASEWGDLPPENSRLGFFGEQSGQTLLRGAQVAETASGCDPYGYNIASGRPLWSKFDPEGLSESGNRSWWDVGGWIADRTTIPLAEFVIDTVSGIQNGMNSAAAADRAVGGNPEVVANLRREAVRTGAPAAANVSLLVPGTTVTGPAALPSEVGLAGALMRTGGAAESKAVATAVVANAEAKAANAEAAPVLTQVQINAKQGAAFGKVVGDNLRKTDAVVAPEITIKTESGVSTRIDFASKTADGTVKLTEAKSSATAPLTANQKAAFPEIAQTGGVVTGKGKPGFEGGTVIPPTQVEVVRPPDPTKKTK